MIASSNKLHLETVIKVNKLHILQMLIWFVWSTIKMVENVLFSLVSTQKVVQQIKKSNKKLEHKLRPDQNLFVDIKGRGRSVVSFNDDSNNILKVDYCWSFKQIYSSPFFCPEFMEFCLYLYFYSNTSLIWLQKDEEVNSSRGKTGKSCRSTFLSFSLVDGIDLAETIETTWWDGGTTQRVSFSYRSSQICPLTLWG